MGCFKSSTMKLVLGFESGTIKVIKYSCLQFHFNPNVRLKTFFKSCKIQNNFFKTNKQKSKQNKQTSKKSNNKKATTKTKKTKNESFLIFAPVETVLKFEMFEPFRTVSLTPVLFFSLSCRQYLSSPSP